MKLENKVAVVTGAGQGIGEGIAVTYANEGAKVAVVDMNIDSATEVASKIIAAGGTAIAVKCDVSNRDEVFAARDEVVAKLGPIDILVSNAGITRPAMLHKMSVDEFEIIFKVHVYGTFHWLQAVVDSMIERQTGKIIFTSSSTAQNGSIGQINYAGAKAAMLGMMRSAARELGKYGITVNAIAPSAVTEMTRVVMTDPRFAGKGAGNALRRHAQPEEVAPPYVFLASEDSAFVTGQVISVDGGYMFVR